MRWIIITILITAILIGVLNLLPVIDIGEYACEAYGVSFPTGASGYGIVVDGATIIE